VKSVYLVSFDHDEPVSVDDRHGLKELLGLSVRAALRIDAPVGVDHLDASEPETAALLPPVVQ